MVLVVGLATIVAKVEMLSITDVAAMRYFAIRPLEIPSCFAVFRWWQTGPIGPFLMVSNRCADVMNLGHTSLQNPITSADPLSWGRGSVTWLAWSQKSNVPRAVRRNDDSKQMKGRYGGGRPLLPWHRDAVRSKHSGQAVVSFKWNYLLPFTS